MPYNNIGSEWLNLDMQAAALMGMVDIIASGIQDDIEHLVRAVPCVHRVQAVRHRQPTGFGYTPIWASTSSVRPYRFLGYNPPRQDMIAAETYYMKNRSTALCPSRNKPLPPLILPPVLGDCPTQRTSSSRP